ncbi:MAG: PIN domain-containing protein [Verrucomicrobia bacterium]|nr:PIN domain-containing protein [Verrucomicrobiota bacterium]
MILPDVNLILYAYDLDSPFHPAAAAWWTKCLSSAETVGVAQVIVFAFLRLSTSSRIFANPFSVQAAIREANAWSEQPNVRVLAADQDDWQEACRLLKNAGGSGNLVTDAQLGAFALSYRGTVHTADTDFQRFPGVSWFNPITGAKGS